MKYLRNKEKQKDVYTPLQRKKNQEISSFRYIIGINKY